MNNKSDSRIPVLSPSPLRRSGSMRLGGCPPIREHCSDTKHKPVLNRHRSLQSLNTTSLFNHDVEDDAASVQSFSSVSGASVCSNLSQCDHAHFARNGTTYSGRSKRFVYHCSPHSTETDDYLTPTQRTNRTIRKLRNLLKEAQEELADKDREIQRLTKEVVELRLLKADCSGDAEEVVEEQSTVGAGTQNPRTPGYSSSPPLIPSLSDSGHFEDLNSSHNLQAYINQIKTLESTLESVQRQHEDEIRELKEKQNDKVDSLLQRITDVNDRYYALRPLYEDCKVKLHELEKLNEELKSRPSQDHVAQIIELENLNKTLSCDKQTLLAEIDSLTQIKEELVATKVHHDRLNEENAELRTKQEELSRVLTKLQDNKYNDCNNVYGDHLDTESQTEETHLCNRLTQEEPMTKTCEQNDRVSILKENDELKKQIEAYVDKFKEMEEQQQKEKDIYVQLYKKGIQAAKMLDNAEVQEDQKDDSKSSLVPELLKKLRIKQDELDNLKTMYRRLLESRKEQPKHDPEMTLQFLKSAFYYFLTDRENASGHLAAIESILGFTDNEKVNIDRASLWR